MKIKITIQGRIKGNMRNPKEQMVIEEIGTLLTRFLNFNGNYKVEQEEYDWNNNGKHKRKKIASR